MAKTGMKTHSESSFNEALEIRILSSFLESEKSIKTFFKENDKTPNYDGTFEILGSKNTPKKQFFVQIKKVENLQVRNTGKNQGKFVHDLETPFLYYVKEKVAEGPAIYFIVDIVTKNIFWLYLSDEVLMKLNFEGKQKVRYAFTSPEILSDIGYFTKLVNDISDERNKKFINRTKEEIIEIQDAVEYINNLFNNDLEFIKKSVFPDLWRFGIAYSQTDDFIMTHQNPRNGILETINPPITNIFALYPQIKGRPDYGMREYYNDNNNYFNHFDMTGTATPRKYVTNTIAKIIEDYFESSFPFDICPEIVLEEIAFKFIDKMKNLLDNNTHFEDAKNVEDCYEIFLILLSYVNHLLSDNQLIKGEEELRSLLVRNIQTVSVFNRIDLISMIQSCGCKQSFIDYYNKMHSSENKIYFGVFPALQKEYTVYFVVLLQLKMRKIIQIERPWKYEYYDLLKLNEKECLKAVNKICEAWLTKLPTLYTALYNKIFDNHRYFNNGRFEYVLKCWDKNMGNIRIISDCIKKYKDEAFIVSKGNFIYDEKMQWKNEKDIESIYSSSGTFGNFFANKLLFYDSLRCLLYQGIYKGLNLKCDGIRIGYSKEKLFK